MSSTPNSERQHSSKHWNTGYTVIKNGAMIDANLNDTEYRIYNIIMSFHYLEGGKQCSERYLQKLLPHSRNTLRKHVRGLLSKGYLRKESSYSHEQGTSTMYSAIMELNVTSTYIETSDAGNAAVGGSKIEPGGGSKIEPGGGSKTDPKEITIKRNNNKSVCKGPSADTQPQNNAYANGDPSYHGQELQEKWEGHGLGKSVGMPLTKLAMIGLLVTKHGYAPQALEDSISNYKTVLNDPNCYYDMKWNFWEFFGVIGKPKFNRFLPGVFDLTRFAKFDRKTQEIPLYTQEELAELDRRIKEREKYL